MTARDVIDATHMPLVSEGKFFAKAYPYAHALVAARVDPARPRWHVHQRRAAHPFGAHGPVGTRFAGCGGRLFKPGETEEGEATLKDPWSLCKPSSGSI